MTKKIVSLVLAVIMLLGCLSVTAFATEPATSTNKTGNTTITAVKASKTEIEEEVVTVSYNMVIPAGVNMTAAGTAVIGTPTVEDVKNATVNTVISYTVSATQLTLENGSATMNTTYIYAYPGGYYYGNLADLAATFDKGGSIPVYMNNATLTDIPWFGVTVTKADWYKATPGTYTATMTFNFKVTEYPCNSEMAYYNGWAAYVMDVDEVDVVVAMYYFNDGAIDMEWSNIQFLSKDEVYDKTYGLLQSGAEYKTGDFFHRAQNGTGDVVKCTNPESHRKFVYPDINTWRIKED